MEVVKSLQNITDNISIDEDNLQETKYKRSAAVATDMCSCITTKTSQHLVQLFYVRSDFPIYTWNNPSNIELPNNKDSNQWEIYLNRFEILSE